MFLLRKLLILSILLASHGLGFAQRTYASNSVLALGNWYKISVATEGVYKIDVPFLASMGISGAIPSAQLQIFGNGGAMLPEGNSQRTPDDLEENAIMVVDGGDGLFNGSDYALFFAQGPDHWSKDSLNRRFVHHKNIYDNKAYYYITIGGAGKRIPLQNTPPVASVTVNSFDERYFHESETVNLLSSGKEWLGEEFAAAPGKTLTRSFTLPFNDVLSAFQATIISNVAARSVNVPSSFSVQVNGQPAQQIEVGQVGAGIYDLYAQYAQKTNSLISPLNPQATFNYTPGSFNSQGWLNWFEFFCRRSLATAIGSQLLFRDWNSVHTTAVEFIISNAYPATQVWDVTDPLSPERMNTVLSGSQLRFTNEAQRLREYVCFSGNFLLPAAVGKIAVQNLHATSE